MGKGIFKNKRQRRTVLAASLSMLLAISGTQLFGCSSMSDKLIAYYTNVEENSLIPYDVSLSSQDTESAAAELFSSMRDDAFSNGLSVIPSNVSLNSIQQDGTCLVIDVTSAINEASASAKLLFCAALVKSMTQLDSVDSILIMADGSPVTDGNGNEYGVLNAESFLEDSSRDPDEYYSADITLYFTTQEKDSLVATQETISYRKGVSQEQAVVEELIKGPQSTAGGAVISALPQGTEILNVSTIDGTCYLNLNGAFLDFGSEEGAQCAIYSIVCSLTGLDTVEKVQLLSEGSSDIQLTESISLATPFDGTGLELGITDAADVQQTS